MKRWDVECLVARYVTVTVEAETHDEAFAQALDWKIIDGERPGDTISVSPIRARQVDTVINRETKS
jgi:hypothetical protein